jgi:glycosyltransferase involved in cell wall biosynthesis
MRIGVNCYYLQPHVGGVRQYLINFLNTALAHDSENTYVLFYFDHNGPYLSEVASDQWQADAIHLSRIDEIRGHLRTVDVYFSPINGLQPMVVPPVPTVIMLPDVQEVYYPQYFTPADLFYRDWYYRVSSHLVDCVITLSGFSKQCLVRHYRLDADRIHIAYPCIDERFFRGSAVARPPVCTLPEDFILYPANRWKHKNHAALLEAMVYLQQLGIRIHAVFTGMDETNGYNLKESAKRAGLDSFVHDLGYVAIEEMAYLYQRARMLVFPTLFEGFGLPLVEAMATGCPIAAANCTSVPEVAGDAALYFDPTSPRDIAAVIHQLWTDADLRHRLSQIGFEQAKKFSAVQNMEAHRQAWHAATERFSRLRHWRNQCLYLPFQVVRVGLKRVLGAYDGPARHER